MFFLFPSAQLHAQGHQFFLQFPLLAYLLHSSCFPYPVVYGYYVGNQGIYACKLEFQTGFLNRLKLT